MASSSSRRRPPNPAAGRWEASGVALPPWPAPTDPEAGIQAAGLVANPMEGAVQHFHAHLDILVDGQPVVVPAYLGIDQRRGQYAELHTHDDSGILHVESGSTSLTFTLGQLFTEWGVKLDANDLGGLAAGNGKQLRAYVDGQRSTATRAGSGWPTTRRSPWSTAAGRRPRSPAPTTSPPPASEGGRRVTRTRRRRPGRPGARRTPRGLVGALRRPPRAGRDLRVPRRRHARRGRTGPSPWSRRRSRRSPLPQDARSVLAHALAERTVGAVLVRRGGYAVGWFAGRRLVASKVGRAYVQGTTKAGGWSQQRYARRRANQTRDAYAETADVAATLLLPHAADVVAVVGGGDQAGVEAVLDDRRLAPLRALLQPRVLPTPDPRLRAPDVRRPAPRGPRPAQRPGLSAARAGKARGAERPASEHDLCPTGTPCVRPHTLPTSAHPAHARTPCPRPHTAGCADDRWVCRRPMGVPMTKGCAPSSYPYPRRHTVPAPAHLAYAGTPCLLLHYLPTAAHPA